MARTKQTRWRPRRLRRLLPTFGPLTEYEAAAVRDDDAKAEAEHALFHAVAKAHAAYAALGLALPQSWL